MGRCSDRVGLRSSIASDLLSFDSSRVQDLALDFVETEAESDDVSGVFVTSQPCLEERDGESPVMESILGRIRSFNLV